MREPRTVGDDTGASTVEAAFGLAALVAVLLLCLAGVTAVSMQVRCIDAAREVARLAARGDAPAATVAVGRIGPSGAAVSVRRDGDWLVATVAARTVLLPGLTIRAESVAAAEPTR